MNRFSWPGRSTLYSYHNHSTWSDGSSSMEEMCSAAKAAGLREFGLSDHYVIHPDSSMMPVSWSIDTEKLDEYIDALNKLKAELDDENFTIRIGLEVDYFSENASEVLGKLEKYPLDYLIGSVHYSGTFPVDGSASYWVGLSEEEIHHHCCVYWEKLFQAAQCGKFLFLGHPDLPKKFGFIRDPEIYLPMAYKVLDAAAATGTGIELNTSGWFKECKEQYPSLAILREADAKKVPLIINPDAHSAEHITRGFAEADKLLRDSGLFRA